MSRRAPPGPVPRSGQPGFVLLAVNRAPGPDSERARALGRLYRGARVVTASESRGWEGGVDPPRERHIDVNFSASIVPAIERGTRAVFLDYFWLQAGYYVPSRYGDTWFRGRSGPSKLEEAFERCPSLQACIIPLDNDVDGGPGTMYRAALEWVAGGTPPPLSIDLLSFAEAFDAHPLVRATALWYATQDLKERKGLYKMMRLVGCVVPPTAPDRMQRDTYANRDATPFSFACVYRRGVDWRSVVGRMRYPPDVLDAVRRAGGVVPVDPIPSYPRTPFRTLNALVMTQMGDGTWDGETEVAVRQLLR